MKEETSHQMAFIDWCISHEYKYPELALIHHIPNGELRNKVIGAKLRRMGVKAGIPDVFLPVAKLHHHGLYIEFKSKSGKLSDSQKKIFPLLSQSGYLVTIARNVDDAIRIIEIYLGV